MKKNIFIEGLQGSGKTTLLRNLSKEYPEYKAYYEGDISPVELAWCSYMTKEEFEKILAEYPHLEEEIRRNTIQEEEHRITSYTRILAENRAFYEKMEQYEIYNGRVSYERFHDVIMSRYKGFVQGSQSTVGNLFECSFFQNSIESMMLFYQMDEKQITEFYREAYEILQPAGFQLLYLEAGNIRENILQIKQERTDEKGVELWYPLMLNYLKDSPYGKAHGYVGFEDMIAHFERRCEIEERILKDVLKEDCIRLKAKKYRPEEYLSIP